MTFSYFSPHRTRKTISPFEPHFPCTVRTRQVSSGLIKFEPVAYEKITLIDHNELQSDVQMFFFVPLSHAQRSVKTSEPSLTMPIDLIDITSRTSRWTTCGDLRALETSLACILELNHHHQTICCNSTLLTNRRMWSVLGRQE